MQDGATDKVRWILRLEGAGVLGAALVIYPSLGLGWLWFALFFFLPDVSLLGYLAGPRVGARIYNLAHAYLGPLACLALGWFLSAPEWMAAGVIWGGHIGFDRALGYGLKYPLGFGYTHLGRIGGRIRDPAPDGSERAAGE